MTELTAELIQQKLNSLVGTRVDSPSWQFSRALDDLFEDYAKTLCLNRGSLWLKSPYNGHDTYVTLVYSQRALYTITYKYGYRSTGRYWPAEKERVYKSFDVVKCNPNEDTATSIRKIDESIAKEKDAEARKKAQAFVDIERIAELLGQNPKSYDFEGYLKYLANKCYDYRHKND